jgi:hypothetical protein
MSDLKKIGQDYLAKNKDVKEVYVTVDSQVFTSKNYASLHARSLKKGKQTYETVTAVKEQDLLTNSKEIIALLEDTTDLQVVEKYAAAEKALPKPRKTVLETIDAKTEDLTKEA